MKMKKDFPESNVKEIVEDAIKALKSNAYYKENNRYEAIVTSLAEGWEGIYQPDSIIPIFEKWVDEEFESCESEEESEEQCQISWDEESIDYIDKAGGVISSALDDHLLSKKNKLSFYFGSSEGFSDYVLFVAQEASDFLKAPEGWKLQDADPDFMSFLRISKVGDWSIDFSSMKSNIKDAYVSAERFEKYGDDWEITTYDPTGGGHGGYKVKSREEAVGGMLLQMKAFNVYEKAIARGKSDAEASENMRKFLEKSR